MNELLTTPEDLIWPTFKAMVEAFKDAGLNSVDQEQCDQRLLDSYSFFSAAGMPENLIDQAYGQARSELQQI